MLVVFQLGHADCLLCKLLSTWWNRCNKHNCAAISSSVDLFVSVLKCRVARQRPSMMGSWTTTRTAAALTRVWTPGCVFESPSHAVIMCVFPPFVVHSCNGNVQFEHACGLIDPMIRVSQVSFSKLTLSANAAQRSALSNLLLESILTLYGIATIFKWYFVVSSQLCGPNSASG